MTETKTGWERERRGHFDEIVANYDRVRWGYPPALFADVMQYAASGGKAALEIGAGTGKATTPFLSAGYDVTAVEMSGNMAAFLAEKFRGEASFHVLTATFEDAALEDSSYDLIYAASAFHWVDAQIGCPKVHRLLKPGGTFALLRNNAVVAEGNALYDEIQSAYDKHYNSYYKPGKRPIMLHDMTYEHFQQPAEIFRGFRFESLEPYGFRDITMKLYQGTLTYSADAYIGLLETYADHRALPDENRAALYAAVREAIERHGGQQRLDCVFQLYMGRK